MHHQRHPPKRPRHGGDAMASPSPVRVTVRLTHKAPPTRKEEAKEKEIASAPAGASATRIHVVVVDPMGHGVAPDQPALAPEPAGMSPGGRFAAAAEDAQTEWEWSQEDAVTLGLVGAALVVVALVVIAIARRQQRAYEHALLVARVTRDGEDASAVHLESGREAAVMTTTTTTTTTTTKTTRADGERIDASPGGGDRLDERNGSPLSVREGCV